MTDVIDQAQQTEEQHRTAALAAVAARVTASRMPHNASVNGVCIDCGDAIEPARLTALRGCTSRCASCAHDHEQRERSTR